MDRATLVATLMEPPGLDGEALASLPDAVNWIEVRADVVGDLDPDWLRQRFGGRLIYALRSHTQGGRFEGSLSERASRLLRASTGYDLVELEECDLIPDLLREIPPEQRLISWHGRAVDYHGLKERFERLSSVQAKIYKLVTAAGNTSDGFTPVLLLKDLD